MGSFPKSIVGLQYFTLTNARHIVPHRAFLGWMSRVRVDGLSRGSAHTQFSLFVGKLNQLFFDPAWWWWPGVTSFIAYSTRFGRIWITSQVVFRKSILDKWHSGIPPSTSLRWNIIWHKHKAHEETTFLWSVIHKAVAVNKWCGRISTEVDKNCPHRGSVAMELVEHMFFSRPLA